MKYIDTHFHLDLWNDPTAFVDKIERSQIYTIAVTNAPSVFKFSYQLAKNKKFIRPALGLHPELASQRACELPLFMDLISQTRYIGEIGLDFSNRNISSKDEQIKVFDKIINKCSVYEDKILTIHSRKAEERVIESIGNRFPGKVILHWYSGSIKTLERALEYGFYFSINYKMTKSLSGQNIIKRIPFDRLLTESDGPFTEINNVSNSPLQIKKTYHNLNLILNVLNSKEMIFKNFTELLQ